MPSSRLERSARREHMQFRARAIIQSLSCHWPAGALLTFNVFAEIRAQARIITKR